MKQIYIKGAVIIGYFVTEDGSVWSEKTKKWIKSRVSTSGYRKHSFSNKGQVDQFVHRLVAEAFIPNPENKRCINHKDGDKMNNHVSNLEWISDSDNQRHSYLMKLNSREGNNNGRAKLNDELIREIRASTETGVALAKRFQVTEGTIRSIKHFRAWKHVK